MSNLLFKNNAISTVGAPISSTGTTLVLAPTTGERFPSPTGSEYFVGTFTDAATGQLTEVVYCTARDVDTLTIVRGQEGTTPQAWNVGDFFGNYWTAGQAETLLPVEWSITDGTTTVANVTELAVSGATVSQVGTGSAEMAIAPPSAGTTFIPPFVSGGFYKIGSYCFDGNPVGDDVMLYYPMPIPSACTVGTLNVFFYVANNSGVLRFALYRDVNGVPNGLIYDSGPISFSPGSQFVLTQSGVNAALTAGIVWVGCGVVSTDIAAWSLNGNYSACVNGSGYMDFAVPSQSVLQSFQFNNFGYGSTDRADLEGTLPSAPNGLVNNNGTDYTGSPCLVTLGIS